MKKIITESQLKQMIKETVRRLLTEDKVSDYIKKQIVNNSRYSKEMLSTPVAELPKDVRSNMQESAPSIYNACVNHGQNLSAFLRLYFLSYFDINHGKGPVEYVMGLARIAIGELKMFDRNAESDTALLKQVVLFLHNSTDEQLKAQYDGNLNGLDFYTLVRQLNGARREFNAANRTRLKGATDGRVSAYKVVAISSAEEAAKYGRYTSWCVTHSEANYDGYTEGGRRFYFCLRDGFEDVPKRAGEGCPLDDYGLSMISVLVDPEGEPNVITTRWNHENDGENNENLHTAEQVQEVTNIDFYATFKPYSLEQLTAMGVTPFYVVQDMLDKGAEPEDIFVKIDKEEYGLRRVYLNRKYNFIDGENKLLFDRWFDLAGSFYEGFAAVRLNNKWNFINTEGQIAFDQWFDNVRIFSEGFAVVGLNYKCNFINTEGQFLSQQWFDNAERFYEGFAAVQLNNKWNFINTEGRILSKQWFDDVWKFNEGFAGVRLNDKWNFINTEGQIAFNQWFDIVCPFSEGFAEVRLNDKWNFINTEGQLLSKQWFDTVWPFSKGVSEVILNGKGYNLDKEGNLTLRESRRIISPTITESQLRNIIKETVRRLLTEDKVSDYIKKQIVNNSRYSKEMLATPVAELPKDVRSNMQESAPSIYNACVNHGQNLSAFLRLYFLSYFDINHGKGPVEYVMGLARIAIGELKMFDRNAESDTALLKQVVLFLHNSTDEQLKAQYDGNLNGLDFYTLVRQLNGARREFNAANRTRLKGATDGRVSAYKVVAINSAEEAAKYGQFTSWCVTHSKANYDGYTEGGRRFYFCLRDGFEDVPKRAGEGCPLDDYGLSMISVLVDSEGEPNVITTRWNHENDGENNENLHTAEQVQEVTNIDFYATFKPYSLEQLTTMGVTPFYVVQDMLDKGAKPEDIFVKIDEEEYGLRRVYLNGKYNFIDGENKLLFDRWFDLAGSFYEGFAAVRLNGKCNYINTEGQLLSNQWFDAAENFNEGFARVKLNGKRNYINTDGQFLSKEWFDWAYDFHEGFAIVRINDKWNLINTEGQLLSKQWFDSVWDFSEGFAAVRLNGKWNYINTEGQLLFKQWFDSVWDFSEGFAAVRLNGKWNFINTEGQLLSKQWFNAAGNFNEGVAEVGLNGKWYNLDKEGNLTLAESRRSLSPIITESIIEKIKSECIKRLMDIK